MILDPAMFVISTSTITAQLLLAMLVLFHNPRSATNRIFAMLTAAFAFWGAANFFTQKSIAVDDSSLITLKWIRFIMLGATIQSSSFFLFVHTFPSEKLKILRRRFIAVIAATVAVGSLALSPYLFTGIYQGTVDTPIPGPGMPLFILYAIGFVGSGLWLLIKKYQRANAEERKPLKFIMIGFLTMFVLIIIFNFFGVILFRSTSSNPYGPAFTLPFVALTTYAIIRHRLFNLKLIATELLVILILFVLIIEAFFSNTMQEAALRAIFIAIVSAGGLALIRSIYCEVREREFAQRLNVELKELDEAKSEFISIASHQLRTPLTAIVGYLSMIKEGDFGKFSEQLKSPLDRVFLSSKRLMNLVETLLDISRIEAGRFEITPEAVDIVAMTKRLVEDFQIQARDKNIRLILEAPKQFPKIWADPLKIEDVLTNLIDNALKYTEKGSVTVQFSMDAELMKCCVKDTGIGLDSDEIAHIFKRFVRGQRAALHHTEGLGMGLYVAERVVAAHGGRIWAESSGKDQGSTFCFTIPINRKQSPVADADAQKKIVERIEE